MNIDKLNSRQHPIEKLDDYTDGKLADLYQARGIIEAGDEAPYSRAQVFEMLRTAYWCGVADQIADPEGTSQASAEAAVYYDSSRP